MVVRARVSSRTRKELGPALMERVLAHLWAQDCQTCGQALGDSSPTLVVRDLMVTATASLHHRGCRRPTWDDDPVVMIDTAALLTHITYSRLMPLATGDGPHDGPPESFTWPILLVNPGLEQVTLRRAPAGSGKQGWALGTEELFTLFGLQVPRAVEGRWELAQLDPEHPIEGGRGKLVGNEIAVNLGPYHWSAPAGGDVVAQVRELGGILLLVTTAVHPGLPVDGAGLPGRLGEAIGAGEVAMGWIGVDAAAADELVPDIEQLEQLVAPTVAAPRTSTAELPSEVPYPGPSYDPASGRFDIGVGADGRMYRWALHTPGRGREHGLVAGPAGCGKSSLLRLILAETIQIAPPITVMIADPLGKQLATPFEPIAAAVAHTVADTVTLLRRTADLVEQRHARTAGRVLDPTPTDPAVLVVLDDAEHVLRDPDAAALALRIVEHGGPTGVGLVVASGSVDPTDYAGDTALLTGLATTNQMAMSPEYFEFLQDMRGDQQR